MNTEADVIEVALKAGQVIWVRARGNPALLVAGAVVAGTAAIGYGSMKYGRKLIERIDRI